MSNESNHALPRHLISAFGAVAASTMMLGIAAAPVRAEPVGTLADAWVDRVEVSQRASQLLATPVARTDVPTGRT
ncbi:hypothetical protein [Sphingomonas sp.]